MPRERFRLPRWFARQEGHNAPTLEALWSGLLRLDPELAARMLYLRQAAGRHLDAHGVLYGVPRLEREADGPYRARILAEVLNPRSTAAAIVGVIESAMPGVTAHVTGPTLEGTALYFDSGWNFDADGENFHSPYAGGTFAVFDVLLEGEDVDLAYARTLVERIRAAGYIPTVTREFALDATLEPGEGITGTSQVVDFPRFNGFRDFDGSWTFGASPLGEPEAL